MSKIAETDPITAALLWDLPTLRRIDDPGAKLFVEVMNRRSPRSEGDGADTALSRAARAVAAELRGENEQARLLYEDMARREGAERLLGLSLQLWSSTASGPELLDEALAEIAPVEDGELRARLYCKLISAALSHQWDSRLNQLMSLAVEAAPTQHRLAAALRTEAYNLGLRALEIDAEQPPPDPLTDYAWISGLANAADAKRLREAVIQAARSPWAITIGFGATTRDDAITALMQAEWAGALWLRRMLQRQLASQVLLDRDSGPDLTAHGLSLWIVSGQRDIEAVASSVEPRFDLRSADLVIGQLDREGPLRRRTEHSLIDAAVALWDLISDRTAVELLDRIELHPGTHPVAHQAAAFWATMSLRVPEAFNQRFLKLDGPQQRALLIGLTPLTVRELPSGAAESLLAAATPPTSDEAHLYALLALRAGRPELVALDKASPTSLIRLRRDAPTLVHDARLAWAIDEIATVVGREYADARTGRRGIGREDSASLLALGIINATASTGAPAVRLLTEAANDTTLPADLRFDALRALTAVADRIALPDDVIATLRELPHRGAKALMGEFPPELIRAASIGVRAVTGEDITHDALWMVRAEEARVRQLAIEACGLALRHGQHSELVEAALANGLFDPATNIVTVALNVLAESWPRSHAVADAVSTRLKTLFGKSERQVRANIVTVAARHRFPDSESILRDASDDRSYLVRDALDRARIEQ
jgi:hypothetical protein